MREKMKKMLFLMLFLLILGAANVSAQVRIGGNGVPNPAAVLDLNADNTNNGTKGLALPRVSLVDINTPLTGSPTVSGMLVYNASGSLSAGVYYWDDNKWVSVSDGTFVEKDSIIGNEVVDATPGRGLVRAGSGSVNDPYSLGITPRGVDTSMLAPPAEGKKLLVHDGTEWRSARWVTGIRQATGQKGARIKTALNCLDIPVRERAVYVGINEQSPYIGLPTWSVASGIDTIIWTCVDAPCWVNLYCTGLTTN